MKKLVYLLALAMFFAACDDDDDAGSTLVPVSYTVDVMYDTATYGGESATGVEVELLNTNTSDTYTATSDASGTATFERILPGTYNITASVEVSDTEFATIFGFESDEDTITFNGSAEQITVSTDVTASEVFLKSARIGDLVIKQIYYAGSDTKEGAVFRDQFMEIYNNSNEVIYADGLYVGQLYGKTNTTTDSYTQSNGQYDWTQSIGMTASDANSAYVYADYVLQIPGSGAEYPIEPGASIVIAQSALNHKSPLVDNDGNPLSVEDPSLTVDLSGADFEAYLGDFRESIGEEPYRYDIQNASVTDLLIGYWGNSNNYSGNKDFLMDNLGRDSFIIFRSDDLDDYSDYPDPTIGAVVEDQTRYYLQIPVSVILDGVDLQHYNAASQRPKMLPSEIDASYIKCDAAYNSQSVIRNTKTTIDGRVILEDTNNSSDDFTLLDMANPGGFAE